MQTKIFITLLCIPLLFACQSSPDIYSSQQITLKSPHKTLYLDKQFHTTIPQKIETEAEIFKLDDEMLAMVQAKLTNNLAAHKKARILLEHLFNEENMSLAYQGNANLTAAQAYQTKKANCMSLTIMAYALATAADMNVSFQSVNVPEYWVRNGQYNLLTGHVNLLVSESRDNNNNLLWSNRATQIDFDPFVAKKKFSSHKIKKHTLLAMFYSNKGAEAMVNKNYLLAYQYLKQATLSDKKFASAWGNLGVLYKLTGHVEVAESAYRHAISLKRNNLTALGNLALLLNMQGRHIEAQSINQYLYKVRIKNPYYHALLAEEALNKKAYQQALQHYKKAIQLDDEQHEFYFGLAKVYYQQHELALSQRVMKKAIALTKRKNTQQQYTAKLHFLKAKHTLSMK